MGRVAQELDVIRFTPVPYLIAQPFGFHPRRLAESTPTRMSVHKEMSYHAEGAVRNHLHQEVVELIEGVYNTDSDASHASLDFGESDPDVRVINGKLHMFHGPIYQYTFESVGALETDDRAFSEYGHIPIANNAITLVKALDKALHDKMFRLDGKTMRKVHTSRIDVKPV